MSVGTLTADLEVPSTDMPSESLSKLSVPAKERLIVALDVETRDDALALVAHLGDAVDFYKVGWELLLSGDYFELIKDLNDTYHKKIFADLKVHEIPVTVSRAMKQLKSYHPTFVTLHAQELAAIDAAVAEANGTKVLAVTVLTSIDQADLDAQGIATPVEDLVLIRAKGALEHGCHGVIASGLEVTALRQRFGDGILVVVPGIRGDKSELDDQKRTVDVEQAFRSGADYIVVGREIRDAVDPRAKALELQSRIRALFPG
jgi:orotidine-5'-phosphate decarboxylase